MGPERRAVARMPPTQRLQGAIRYPDRGRDRDRDRLNRGQNRRAPRP